MKLDGTSMYEAAEINERGWKYQGKGFGCYGGTLDYNGPKVESFFLLNNPEDVGIVAERATTLDVGRARALDTLCAYCRTHDITLYVVAPPVPDFTLVELGDDYLTLHGLIKDYVEARGGRYFDMNLARPELMKAEESFFHDSSHLNAEGAKAFTCAVARLVSDVEEGRDVSGLFGSWKECLERIDHVSAVFVSVDAEADGCHCAARALAGPHIEVKYQYLRKRDGEWEVLRDWSFDSDFVFAPADGEHGRFELCAGWEATPTMIAIACSRSCISACALCGLCQASFAFDTRILALFETLTMQGSQRCSCPPLGTNKLRFPEKFVP